MTDLATDRLNRTLRVSVIPSSILLLFLFLSFTNIPSLVSVKEWIPSVAVAVLGFGLLLSLLTRQSRMTFICFNLLLADWALNYSSSQESNTPFFLITFLTTTGILLHSSDLAFRDELTRLPSRRALEQYLLTLGRRYTIAMADIDHFKKVNDTYGHDIGDQVLKLIASRLAKVKGAKAFRYGGEEFTLIFPRRTLEDVLPQLEILRKQIKAYKMVLRIQKRKPGRASKTERLKRTQGSYRRAGTKTLHITISIGAASKEFSGQEPSEVITAADEALYHAKKTGRNRVCH